MTAYRDRRNVSNPIARQGNSGQTPEARAREPMIAPQGNDPAVNIISQRTATETIPPNAIKGQTTRVAASQTAKPATPPEPPPQLQKRKK